MNILFILISLSLLSFSQLRFEPEIIVLDDLTTGEIREITITVYNDSGSDLELLENSIIGRDDVINTKVIPQIKANSSSELIFDVEINDNIHFSNAICFDIINPNTNKVISSDCIPVEIDGKLDVIDTDGNDYYADTYNKFGFDLFIELEDLVKDHKFYTYRDARTFMWEDFNNINGEVECVYTGRKIQHSSGIPNVNETRFNTEHTWPQSKGSDYEPPKSDLHHIFPTYEQANSTRASFPYGYVDNPNWEEGGSKLGVVNGETVFEVRDSHKGNTARAIYYFALRYGNVENYINSQEDVLNEWNFFDLPDEFEKTRNDKIYGVQENRNPFVDNPNFIKRIGNYSSQGSYPEKGYLEISKDEINFDNSTIAFNTSINLFAANIGYQDIEILDILYPNYLTLETNVESAPWQEISKFTFTSNFENEDFKDNGIIQFVTKDSIYVVDINVDIISSVDNINYLQLYPNPFSEEIKINTEAKNIELVNIIGNQFKVENRQGMIDLENLTSGLYILRWELNDEYYYSKVIKN